VSGGGDGRVLSGLARSRHRQISREAVRKRTTTAGGPIPVHGPKRLIDVDEADTLWEVTKTAPADHRTYQEARTAKMVVDAKRAALQLRVREGELVDRQPAERVAEQLLRRVRDSLLRRPARVAPGLATRWTREAAEVADALAAAMREQLDELADVALHLSSDGPPG
jgi:hypothetical protein